MMEKKTSGRKKIEIKKIEGTNNSRHVTFSKRRKGLFNKAGEICALTGAETLILAQSIGGGRVFAFAHPDVDSVIDTFLGNNNASISYEDLKGMCEEYNKKYSEILQEIEDEKEKSNSVDESEGFWWEDSFEDLKIDELEIFTDSMEKLKDNVTKEADGLRNSDMSSSIDNIANANIVNGLLDAGVILPNLDQFPSDNVGTVANEHLMMPPVNYDSSGFNNYRFGNGGLVPDNHDNQHYDGGNDLQIQSNFGTFGVPDDLYFGQDYK